MEPFLGQLALFAFDFMPKGWAVCAGQLLPINTNQALFSLLGTTYGGDGRTTFGLPNLQGRVPIGSGQGYTIGQAGGEELHTLSLQEVPTHNHTLQADNAPAAARPANALLAQTSQNLYSQAGTGNTTLSQNSVGITGGSQPHENRSPYLVMTWCIALVGIYPSRN
jgi:microcystin-dependent protein